MSKFKSAISPVMRRLSAYIAGAPKEPLPREAAECSKHYLADTLAGGDDFRIAPAVPDADRYNLEHRKSL